MKKRFTIETTNQIHGCLEQGGICNQIMSYHVDQFPDIPNEILTSIGPDEMIPGFTCSLRELVNHRGIPGHTVRKGTIIQ